MTTPEIASLASLIVLERENDMSSLISADFGSGTGMLMNALLYMNVKYFNKIVTSFILMLGIALDLRLIVFMLNNVIII